MVITEYADPVPHIIVDNFLSDHQYNQVFDEIETSLAQIIAGQVATPNGSQEVVTNFKRNGNVWLDPFESNIVNIFRNNFYNINSEFDELDIASTARTHEVLLSQYASGDFYDWHTDLGGHVTWNYFIFRDPKQFSGGDFVLSNAVGASIDRPATKLVECVNNRLVIFPAQYQHSVTPVEGFALDPMSLRYSIQVFFR